MTFSFLGNDNFLFFFLLVYNHILCSQYNDFLIANSLILKNIEFSIRSVVEMLQVFDLLVDEVIIKVNMLQFEKA